MRESHERHSEPQAKNLVFPPSCNEEDPSTGPQGDRTTHSRRRGKREVSRASLSIPAWSEETYRSMFRAICSGRVIHGSELQRLQFLIGEKLNVQSVLLCGSGSLALELALLAYGVQKGDEVVLPSFCCSSIVSPIAAIGATPVLADVGGELNLTVTTIDPVLTRKTKSIIVPHLFGNPADIAPIVELARSRKISVIDDAAQALGATIDRQPAGSFGNAGILSFGPEKISSGLGGGALVFRDPTMPCRKLRKELAPPSLSSALGELSSNFFRHHWRRLPKSLRDADPGAAPKAYRRRSLANLNAVAALRSMETLEENVAARRARIRAYQNVLGGDERFQLIAHRPGSACGTQVVRVLPRKRGVDLALRAISALGEAGFEVRGSYVPIHLIEHFRSCVWDRLPHTDRVWADLIELPCEPCIDFDDIERIAATLRKVVS